ncbi:MAG: hypothetical protein WC321_03395 [Candidatus Omnitrophota bacterium]|jgi:DNA polymerase III delta subunit
MVAKSSFLHLFIGRDSYHKDIKLARIKQEVLSPQLQDFNLDILYARDLSLNKLQEQLLWLPLGAKKRIVVIKEAQSLKEELKGFILKYIKSPQPQLILILDISRQDPKDRFIKQFASVSQVYRFGEDAYHLDTFSLSRQIELRRADFSLRLLDQLLKNGEKPERIMGGLRYVWEKDSAHPLESRKRLRLLLNCDIEIKRGRLLPQFALEKLVVSLCALSKGKKP